tara:strand:+ start:2352 stop:3449 length:1098 start_codon:yes stop_codon:yes gene_type:complete
MRITIIISAIAAILGVFLRPIIAPGAYADLEIFRQLSIIFCLFLVARRDLDADIIRSKSWWVNELFVRALCLSIIIILIGFFIDISALSLVAFLSALICGMLYLEADPTKTWFSLARNFRKFEESILLISIFLFSSFLPLEYSLTCLFFIVWLIYYFQIEFSQVKINFTRIKESLRPIFSLRFITVITNSSLELIIFIMLYKFFQENFLIYDIYVKIAIFPLIAIQSYIIPRLALEYKSLSIGTMFLSIFIGISCVTLFHLVFISYAADLSQYTPLKMNSFLIAIILLFICYQWLALRYFQSFSQNGKVLFFASIGKAVTCLCIFLLLSKLSLEVILILIPLAHIFLYLFFLGAYHDRDHRFRLG